MGMFETANALAILAAGRNPQWQDQADFTGPPDSLSSGIALGGAMQTMVSIKLRTNVHRREARVTVTFDAATTYTVTAAGVASVGATGANLAALMLDLIAKVHALAAVSAVADPDDPLDTVLITGASEADYTIDASVAGGAGTIAVVADATTATGRLYGTLGGTNGPDGWDFINEATFSVTSRNWIERIETPGVARLYVELADVDGTGDGGSVTYLPVVSVGPCVTE